MAWTLWTDWKKSGDRVRPRSANVAGSSSKLDEVGRSVSPVVGSGSSKFVSLSPIKLARVSPTPTPKMLNKQKSGAVAVCCCCCVVVVVVVLIELILTGDRLSPVDLIPSRLVPDCHQTVHRCSFND